jgi:hypothetical protein
MIQVFFDATLPVREPSDPLEDEMLARVALLPR